MSEALMFLAGNLGQDPSVQYGKSGKAYVKFSVAVTTGKDEEKTTFWQRCTAFGDQAEALGNLCNKGTSVVLLGYMKPNNWTDKDGNKHESNDLIIREIGSSLVQRRSKKAGEDTRGQNRDTSVSGNAGGYTPPPPEDEIPF